MHRLFVAIRPPRDMRQALLAAMGGVQHARWQSDEQLHLTLRFIGEVDRHQAEDAAAALGQVHHPRFRLALAGLGQFDRKGRADALWAAVTPHDAVAALHRKVDSALARVGIARETRAFLPHITIARFGREAGSIAGLMRDAPTFDARAYEIADFALYESELTPAGSLYTIVARYKLS